MSLPRFSRSLYRDFVTAFKERRLDDSTEPKIAGVPETPRPVSAKRREYLREYVRSVVARFGGNRTAAAEALLVTPRTIFRYLEE